DLSPDGRIDNGDTDVLSAHWQEAAAALPVFYYHFDGLGSVVALSDAVGNVVQTYAYDAYGRSQSTGPATGNPYRFAGYRFDPETGLYFCRVRYYTPAIGRFLQPAPLGYADGINWYLYCANNPVMLIDPLGLCGFSWWDKTKATTAGVVNAFRQDSVPCGSDQHRGRGGRG
ncbi:MAG: RHS repeat-associated core domain-containing protein, partial [Planctomycetes bacterium]|nr:RHS repeat-associated core domain-containing protein [Planctomycetota bacterium]